MLAAEAAALERRRELEEARAKVVREARATGVEFKSARELLSKG